MTYTLYNEYDESIMTMKREFSKSEVLFQLEKDLKHFATITINKGFSKKHFSIEPQKMETRHNKSKLSYTLMKDGNSLGKVTMKLFRLKTGYTMELFINDEDILLLLVALVIFMDEVEPSILGSMFKKLDWLS